MQVAPRTLIALMRRTDPATPLVQVTHYLGIDPGLSGTLALYDPASGAAAIIRMPTVAVRTGRGKVRRRIDTAALWSLVQCLATLEPRAMIEAVHGMPGQGAGTAFTFGTGYGQLLMALAASGIECRTVAPATWKAAMRCPRDKDGARALASKLLPQHARQFARAGDDGCAEATLIALYAAALDGARE